MASGAQALGAGITSAAKGVSVLLEAQNKAEDHELERRLLDFRLKTEMDLEEHKRKMPAGGAGYATSWNARYREEAKAFVGEKYANIPARKRSDIDTLLTRHEVMLQERAQRDEYAERDRQTIADLETTMGRTVSAVEANPDRLEEMSGETSRLIDSATLTPAMREQYRKKVRATLEEAAAGSLADNVRDAAGYARAKELLAPHRAERVTAKGVRADLGGVSAKYESGGKGVGFVSSGRGDPGGPSYGVHQLSSKDSMPAFLRSPEGAPYAERLQGMRVGSAEFNRAYKAIASEDAQGLEAAQKAYYTRTHYEPLVAHARTKGLDVEDRGVQEALFSIGVQHGGARKIVDAAMRRGGATPEEQIRALYAARTEYVRGLGTLPDDTKASVLNRYVREERDALALAGSRAGSAQPAEPQADAYDGPFANLSLAKRRAIWGRAEATMAKIRTGVEQTLKSYEEGALNGRLPSEQELSAIETQIRAMGDQSLAAKYTSVLEKARFSSQFMKLPPSMTADVVRRLEQTAGTVGTSKELEDRIQWARKNDEALRKAVNADPMTWAVRNGVEVPAGPPPEPSVEQVETTQAPAAASFRPVVLDTLDFRAEDIDARLAHRFEQAKAVGAYYEQAPQVFTVKERDFLKDVLRLGGPPMLKVMGDITRAATAAGVEPMDVMREFSKDAPELSVIGTMVVSGADRRVLETAATALAWRAKQGEKFESTIDKAVSKPDLDEYRDVLASTPTNVDAVKQTAAIVYEYQHRQQGKKDFDPALYREVVKQVMGETKAPDGTVYGGVGYQGAGWFDGKWGSGWGNTPKVLVPPEVRQDSFDDMVGAIRSKDLAADPPVDGNGKPLTMSQVRTASWVSVGPGRYALEMSRDSDGTRVIAYTRAGQPYVLDVRPLLPAIRSRKPEIFRGFDGTQRPVIEPDDAPTAAPATISTGYDDMQRRAVSDRVRALGQDSSE